MHYGDLVRLTDFGIGIGRQRCSPIGIHDGSRVWAALFYDPDAQPPSDSAVAKTLVGHPHLVLSPIPFDAWFWSYQIQVHLRDRKGAVAEAAACLGDAGLSVLATHCSRAGFGHAAWTLIVEDRGREDDTQYARMRHQLDSVRQLGPVVPRDDDMQEAIHAATAWAYRRSEEIASIFKRENHDFVHWDSDESRQRDRRAAEVQQEFPYMNHDERFFDLSKIDDEVTKRAYQRHRTSVITCKWLDHLAYIWLNASAEVVPAFQYSGTKQTLVSRQPEVLREIVSGLGVALPTSVLAMFNRKEHYVRVGLAPQYHSTRALHVTVEYAWRLARNGPQSTRGLLKAVTETFAESGYNLLYLDNALSTRRTRITPIHPESERGKINATVEVPIDRVATSLDSITVALQAKLDAVARRLRRLGGVDGGSERMPRGASQSRLKLQCVASEILKGTMFLSTRFGYWRGGRRGRKDIIVDEMRRHGFAVTTADNSVSDLWNPMSISEDAQLRIEHALAFVQVIPRLNSERDDSERLQWIMFERGIAMAKRIPCAYCVQVDHRRHSEDIAYWKKLLSVQGDAQLYTFDAESDDAGFREQIRAPIRRLAEMVSESSGLQ